MTLFPMEFLGFRWFDLDNLSQSDNNEEFLTSGFTKKALVLDTMRRELGGIITLHVRVTLNA